MGGIDPEFGEFNFNLPVSSCGENCDCHSDQATPQQFADQLMESTMAALKSLTDQAGKGSIDASKAILQFSVSMTMFGAGEVEEF